MLGAWSAWRWRSQRGLLAGAALGLGIGIAVLALLQSDLSAYLESRRGISVSNSMSPAALAWANLKSLLGPGDRMLISAAPYDPWPPRWLWPLALLGLPLLWARWRGLLLALLAGLTPLMIRLSDAETHRFYLAWLAICVAAGASAARIRKTKSSDMAKITEAETPSWARFSW